VTLTPGAYLKHRRTAAGLSVADVAGRLASEPRTAEHARAHWLELVEADVQPLGLSTVVALQGVFAFDLSVLLALEELAQGRLPRRGEPALCRICACSWHDACATPGGGCSWVERDLCSACATPAPSPPAPAAAIAA
jgi:hypothetical protein